MDEIIRAADILNDSQHASCDSRVVVLGSDCPPVTLHLGRVKRLQPGFSRRARSFPSSPLGRLLARWCVRECERTVGALQTAQKQKREGRSNRCFRTDAIRSTVRGKDIERKGGPPENQRTVGVVPLAAARCLIGSPIDHQRRWPHFSPFSFPGTLAPTEARKVKPSVLCLFVFSLLGSAFSLFLSFFFFFRWLEINAR